MQLLFRQPIAAAILISTAMLSACGGGSQKPITKSEPEKAPPAVTAETFMAATAHPLASEAAADILEQGGSAVDAAIAAQMVLTLVEPQSSGIGGGGFLMSFDKKTGDIDAYDGRETAPASAGPELFLDDNGDPQPWFDANIGGKAVGVPGLVAMLYMAHGDHGKLPWADLFGPAIDLAERGFTVTPRLNAMIKAASGLRDDPASAALYYDANGNPLAAGTLLKNPDLANTFRRIAEEGPDGFNEGPIARNIARAVSEAAVNPRQMTVDDIASYQPIKRKPVCTFYRMWLVCGMPPPSSGGIAIAQILGMLQEFDLATKGPETAEGWHLIAEASRLAFADRNTYVADSDFLPVPTQALIDPAYLSQRAQEISIDRAAGPNPVFPGVPTLLISDTFPASPETENKGLSTTHLSIVDAEGNAVALTSSLNIPFGSRITVDGFLLNSELTDFDFDPVLAGSPAPNRVEPGKRPRSSMSPTLVFGGDGSLVMTLGSPGGSNIIGYVTKTLVATLDWDKNMQDAISLGTILNKNGKTIVEADQGLETIARDLRRKGHETQILKWGSGLQGIRVRPDGLLEGGADPRREGVAIGG